MTPTLCTARRTWGIFLPQNLEQVIDESETAQRHFIRALQFPQVVINLYRVPRFLAVLVVAFEADYI